MDRLRKNIRPVVGNCLASNINEEPNANLTDVLWPPGKLTNTVATAANPSPRNNKGLCKHKL